MKTILVAITLGALLGLLDGSSAWLSPDARPKIGEIILWSAIAAAFIGPGTVTTAASAGAGYGLTLLWAVLFSVVATFVLQEAAARLCAQLDDAAVLLQGGDHRLSFDNVVAIRLLHVDIFAGLASMNGRQRMPMVWRTDADRVQV